MDRDIAEILFPVVISGLGLETAALQLSPDECRELLRFGEGQSILSIIYTGLEILNAPRECLDEYSKSHFGSIYRYMNRDLAIKQISSVLDSEEIPYILLKGAVLQNLYPGPELRTSHDIDILVQENDLDKAAAAIESSTEFKYLKKGYHDISMRGPEILLELHFTLKENAENLDGLLERAWDYTVPSGEGSRCDFTPEYQMFHIISHMEHHFLHGGLGIRPFIDLWLLNKKTSFDERKVRDMCESCGILKFYEESCMLSRVWFEGETHTDTSKMFEAICLSGGALGTKKFKNAARQKEKRGLSYIAGRVFPPAYEVREYYKDESGKEHNLSYYYMKRLLSWTGKERRGDLYRQVQEILSSDQKYLDMADELLKRLDLR